MRLMSRSPWKRRCLGILTSASAVLLPAIAIALPQDGNPATQGDEFGWEAFNRKSVEELILDLETDPDWLTVIQRLRVLDDERARSPLRRAFSRVEGKTEKQAIAAALLSLGVRDVEYFEYLAGFAREVAESDVPFPLELDEAGNPVAQVLSQDFLRWCQEKGLEPIGTSHLVVYEWPKELMMLTWARDPRAAAVFLRAIRSPNAWVVYQGIEGLAVLQMAEAIPAIVEAIQRIPPSFRRRCALPLSLFEDPAANEALSRWVDDARLIQGYRDSRLRAFPSLGPAG